MSDLAVAVLRYWGTGQKFKVSGLPQNCSEGSNLFLMSLHGDSRESQSLKIVKAPPAYRRRVGKGRLASHQMGRQ